MKTTIYDFNELGRTHKSIGVNEVITNAVENQVNTISVISSGNYINSLIREIRNRGLEDRLRVVNLSNENLGLECSELTIEKERVLRDSAERERFVAQEMGDSAGRVRDYTDYIPNSYLVKAEEILESQPDYVSLGIGSGKLFLALARKIKEKGFRTKLIGVVPRNENGIFNDDNLYERDGKLYFRSFDPKSPADKLVCPYTYHKPEILQSQRNGHILVEVDDRDFRIANKRARKLGLESEVSGSAGFVLLDPQVREKYGIPENANVVLINTGRGYNWEKQIRRERRKKGFFAGLASLATAASLLIGGFLYSQKPSAEELCYADLNRDGVVTAEEIDYCNGMAGIRDLGKPISRKTLAEVKKIKENLIADVKARYHNDYKAMHRALDNEVNFQFMEDLSFNQLHYLSDRAQFVDLSNPEMYRGRLMRYMQLSQREVHVEPWDVN